MFQTPVPAGKNLLPGFLREAGLRSCRKYVPAKLFRVCMAAVTIIIAAALKVHLQQILNSSHIRLLFVLFSDMKFAFFYWCCGSKTNIPYNTSKRPKIRITCDILK